MKNIRLAKGAASAAVAAALLMGGVGSLAYWSDSAGLEGIEINSGHLDLEVTNTTDWRLNNEGDAYNSDTQRLVPGDKLTKSATFTAEGAGDYLDAHLAVVSPSWNEAMSASQLTDELAVKAVYSLSTDQGENWSPTIPIDQPLNMSAGWMVRVTFIVDWAFGAEDNDANSPGGFTARLNDLAITLTQNNIQEVSEAN